MFDPQSHDFMQLPKLPKRLSGLAAVIINQKIYVLGGHDGVQIQKKCYTLNLESNEGWKEFPEMNYRRDELGATVGPEGYIYAMGGYGS